jgi:hypothetical protein
MDTFLFFEYRWLTNWQAIDQIGEIYFGIQIRRQTNILDMMGSMFGGGGEPPRQRAPQLTGTMDLD